MGIPFPKYKDFNSKSDKNSHFRKERPADWRIPLD